MAVYVTRTLLSDLSLYFTKEDSTLCFFKLISVLFIPILSNLHSLIFYCIALIIHLKITCAWFLSTTGHRYNHLAHTLQEIVNGQTQGTSFRFTLSPLLFRALCSCQRRKSTVLDNDQLAVQAAGQLDRRRRKWL